MKTTYEPLDLLIRQSPLSIVEIADRVGVSRQRLFQFRQDPTTMSIEQMESLAKILKVDFKVIHDIHKQSRK